MERYLIVSPHTKEDCVRALQQIEAAGYLTHFDWGCKDGDHTGWLIIEADSKSEALMVVPTSQRPTSRVVKLTKFSAEDIRGVHSA